MKISELMGLLRDYGAKHGDQEVTVVNMDAGEEKLFIIDLAEAGGPVLRVGVFGD